MEYDKFDRIIYYVEESNLSDSDKISKVVELFPDFDELNTHNDTHVTRTFLERFAYAIGLGLSVVEAARSIDVSATLIYELYNGRNISLENLVNFAKAITFSRARTKGEHLRNIEESEGVMSSIQFLEKAYSKGYGDRKIINVETGFATEEDEGWEIEVHHIENKIAAEYEKRQKEMEGNVAES